MARAAEELIPMLTRFVDDHGLDSRMEPEERQTLENSIRILKSLEIPSSLLKVKERKFAPPGRARAAARGPAMTPEEMVSDLLEAAETPDHRKPAQVVAEFVREFVMLGIRYNAMFEEFIRKVEGWYPPDKVDRAALEKGVKKLVRFSWGDDPGLDMLTRVLARGWYIS